jgi:hypothetical protein
MRFKIERLIEKFIVSNVARKHNETFHTALAIHLKYIK